MQYHRKHPQKSPSSSRISPAKAPRNKTNIPGKTQEEDKTRTERVIDRIKRHPFILIAGLFLALLVAGGTAFSESDTIITGLQKYFPRYFPTVIATPTTAALPPRGTTFCIYQEHKGSVNTVAWSPNGRDIASGGKDGTVRIWDAMTCKDVTIYRGHKGSVNSISWSPDSSRIVSGGDDATVQVWLADTGSPLFTYHPDGCGTGVSGCGDCSMSSFKQVSSVAWSADGSYIAFGSLDGRIRVFNADTGACIFSKDSQWEVRSVAWSTDSKRIVIGENSSGKDANGIIQIWDVNSNSLVSTYNLGYRGEPGGEPGGINYLIDTMGISPGCWATDKNA